MVGPELVAEGSLVMEVPLVLSEGIFPPGVTSGTGVGVGVGVGSGVRVKEKVKVSVFSSI